jgi:hypothetical protein
MANKMLEECRKVAPELFPYGSSCEKLGYCKEKESCGKFPTKKEALKK